MNDNRITGLTSPPDADDEATNKKYVDENISKANIEPSHTPKNVFQYLMNDVNEWSTEYKVKVESFSDLSESPHSWDKRVLNISPIKSGRNYRFRLGLQMFRMKTNESYSLVIELYNRDYKTWQRQETFVNGTGMWVISNSTTKYQYRYGSSEDLYYSKTLIKFKKTSSSAPIFVYFTAHFDDNGGDMNTYPKEFKNQVYFVAYRIEGLTDHVDSEVYDAHEAFEIDKTKMKMLVPLDMNGKKIMNTSFDLKIGNLFKFITCFAMNYDRQTGRVDKSVIIKKSGQNFSTSTPMFLHSIRCTAVVENESTSKPIINIVQQRNSDIPLFVSYFEGLFINNKNTNMFTKSISVQAPRGIREISIHDLNNKLIMTLDLVISYI